MVTFNINIHDKDLAGVMDEYMRELTEEEQQLLAKIYNKFLDKSIKDLEELKIRTPVKPIKSVRLPKYDKKDESS